MRNPSIDLILVPSPAPARLLRSLRAHTPTTERRASSSAQVRSLRKVENARDQLMEFLHRVLFRLQKQKHRSYRYAQSDNRAELLAASAQCIRASFRSPRVP